MATAAPINLSEILRPVKLLSISLEGVAEVGRAREKHGPNTHLEFGNGEYASILRDLFHIGRLQDHLGSNGSVEAAIKRVNDELAVTKEHSRFGILLEEVIEAGASNNNADLRAELIQVIAMAADWVADIDALA